MELFPIGLMGPDCDRRNGDTKFPFPLLDFSTTGLPSPFFAEGVPMACQLEVRDVLISTNCFSHAVRMKTGCDLARADLAGRRKASELRRLAATRG